jgi:hypothetical protein
MASYGPPQAPGYGPAFAQPPMGPLPPPKKKGISTGCIIAIVMVLLFFGGIGAVVLVIGYTVSQDKDVQNVFGAIGDATKIVAEAQTAPGTAELRGLGCEQAMALDPAKMAKIADRFTDAGVAPPSTANFDRIVMCQVSAFGTAPSCDDAARAYVRGASPSNNFMLSVQEANKHRSCGGIYSPAGALLTPMGAKP